MRPRVLLVPIALAACAGSAPNTPDAAPPDSSIDAPPPTVIAVTCPATPDKTISAIDGDDTSYTPSSVTILLDQIVKFNMPSSHDVVPNTIGTSDPGLNVNFSETKCLMFTKTGTFGFHCGPHTFTGTVVVQLSAVQ
jgi:plastocyanin